jgi:hypothetical protein
MIPLVALLVACGMAATPAPAKTPRSFWGVVLSDTPTARDFQKMGKGKVGTLRLQVNWSAVQPYAGACSPNPGSACDWSSVDPIVAGIAHAHIQGLATLYGSPGWVSHNGGFFAGRFDPLLSSAGQKGWPAFVSAAAKRYGPHGTFWNSNPQLPYDPIRRWQVWNEQNSSNAFHPRPSPKDYAKLVKITSRKVKATDKHAQIILGGMFGTPGGAGAKTVTAWKFLSKLYGIAGTKRAFDAIALHPYSPNIAGIKFQVEKLRKVLARHHDSKSKLWLTELGWGSDAKHVHGNHGQNLTKTPKQQKNLLVNSFKLLRSHRTSWNVAGVTWYSFRDPVNTAGQCTFCLSSGLVKKDFKPKPAWFAYVKFTGGKP